MARYNTSYVGQILVKISSKLGIFATPSNYPKAHVLRQTTDRVAGYLPDTQEQRSEAVAEGYSKSKVQSKKPPRLMVAP